ncbi:MAG: alpha/beta fold hydrolase [Burkholderiaceae bacterium]|jgi:3-oxoadipate enol-lactonase|nr:alpha/beta fold hydrolase [Burkholderiaceae bacterium]
MTEPRRPSRAGFVEHDGARLHYVLSGRVHAPTVVLLHALGADHTMWEAQLEPLERAFGVLRIDMRGHGKSTWLDGVTDAAAAREDRQIADYAADVLAVLDALHVERAHWCGLSMGGMVAMWAASQVPAGPGQAAVSQRVARLVLANTSACMGPRDTWDARIAMVQRDGVEALAAGVGERWYGAGFRARHPEVVAASAATLRATTARGYVEACAAIRGMDQRAALGGIAAPTLIIAGTQDVATPLEQAELLLGAIPGADLLVLDAGHMSAREQAEEFSAALLEFLQDY